MVSILLSGTGPDIWKFVQVLLIFIFVLFMCVVVTKFVGGYQKNLVQNRNMQIISSMKVGNNKFIAVIKVADKYLVIGVAKDNISMLTELTDEEAYMISSKSGESFGEGFKNVMEKLKNKFPQN